MNMMQICKFSLRSVTTLHCIFLKQIARHL